MSLRTLIIDDEPLARRRLRTLLADEPGFEIIGEAGDGDSAVALILEQRPDLLLLDVQMPGRDGFEVLEAVAPTFLPAVIFVTAFDRYAVAAFEARALDYLLKPFSRARLQQALEVVRARAAAPPGADLSAELRALLLEMRGGHLQRLAVSSGRNVQFLDVEQIDWVESEGNYLRLHAGGETHLVRGTLKSLGEQLDPRAFVRVRRDVVVRIGAIRSIQPYSAREHTLLLADGARVVSTPSYNRALRQLMRNPI